jgi:hypothetical protein
LEWFKIGIHATMFLMGRLKEGKFWKAVQHERFVKTKYILNLINYDVFCQQIISLLDVDMSS